MRWELRKPDIGVRRAVNAFTGRVLARLGMLIVPRRRVPPGRTKGVNSTALPSVTGKVMSSEGLMKR
tara:strand:- start:3917 stop:4117 length:201 start_codon:yes stop_codon:yes gene_type:complete